MKYHYSSQEPPEYLPEDKPFAVPWYGIVHQYPPESEMGYGMWNLLWLMSPDLDRALSFSRSYGPDWATVKMDTSLSVLHPLWPELVKSAAQHPTRFRTWLAENAGHFYLETLGEEKLGRLSDRLNDVVAQFAETWGPDGPPLYDLSFHPRTEGNVVYLNPRIRKFPRPELDTER